MGEKRILPEKGVTRVPGTLCGTRLISRGGRLPLPRLTCRCSGIMASHVSGCACCLLRKLIQFLKPGRVKPVLLMENASCCSIRDGML